MLGLTSNASVYQRRDRARARTGDDAATVRGSCDQHGTIG